MDMLSSLPAPSTLGEPEEWYKQQEKMIMLDQTL